MEFVLFECLHFYAVWKKNRENLKAYLINTSCWRLMASEAQIEIFIVKRRSNWETWTHIFSKIKSWSQFQWSKHFVYISSWIFMLVYFIVLLPQSRAVLMSALYSFNLSLSPIQDVFIEINLAPITFLPKEDLVNI